MKSWQTLAAGIGIAGIGVVAAHAADVPFNVKPGLWEVTSSGSSKGTLPIPPEALARMPPEQRAKLEAAMQRAIARGNESHARKSCLTAEQLRRGPDFEKERAGCTRTVVRRTGSEIDIRNQCTGTMRQMNIHFRALSAERISGTVDAEMSDHGHQMTVHRQINGKWLGADCGSVKPAGH